MNYYLEIAKLIAETIDNIDVNEVAALVEIPPDSKMGDFAFPCFRLSKILKKSPNQIAEDLKNNIKLHSAFEKVNPLGPYLNFFVNKKDYVEEIISKILEQGERYGSSNLGADKTVTIDYSSPNVTHQFHIGHLFSTVIGASIYRIYKFLGYNTIGINYIGDWGAQFGKLLCAYEKWSSKNNIEKDGIEELAKIYIKFHDEAEKNPELNKEARNWLVKMEQGDEYAISTWKWFRKICLDDMETIYNRLGITFDLYRGESYYNDKMNRVAREIDEKGLLKESDGAKIVDLEKFKMPPCLILRSDGGTLYPTRDIAAALDRKETFGFDKSIYVTDMRQSLHFAQFFKVLELMGYKWSNNLHHVAYGLLSLETGPLSARKGNIILLKDLFDEAAKRALNIINEKNSSLENKEKIAEEVGLGAVIFETLYTNRIKDLVFSWDKALNFDGETGPYVQYTHARANSVLEKSGVNLRLANLDFSVLTDDSSVELVKALNRFPKKIIEASEKFEPYIVSRNLIEIAQTFNKFYHDNQIINTDPNVKITRLALVKCVKDTLKSGLNLLGIKAPNQM